MSRADEIYDHVRKLPESVLPEVLDFIGYLEMKIQRDGKAQAVELPAPLSVGVWPSLTVDRETIYGDDGR
jgi:hypothetical protein